MTKRDLLEFLEPFSDEIEIVIEEDMALLDAAQPRYVISTWAAEDAEVKENVAARVAPRHVVERSDFSDESIARLGLRDAAFVVL